MSTLRKQSREADRAAARIARERQQEPGRVTVFVTTGVRISDGPGPGVRRVLPDEAGRLVRDRVAVYGEKPPRGFSDGGTGR